MTYLSAEKGVGYFLLGAMPREVFNGICVSGIQGRGIMANTARIIMR